MVSWDRKTLEEQNNSSRMIRVKSITLHYKFYRIIINAKGLTKGKKKARN